MNIKKVFTLIFSCLLLVACAKRQEAANEVDFEESLGKNSSDWQTILEHPGNKKRVTLLKDAFTAAKSAPTRCERAKIPKVIHQIWLGPKSLPAYYWEYKRSWEKMHPGWEYRLWQDKDAEAFDFELKDLFNQSNNWGEKSDILRAEILQAYGGVYVDVDVECKKPFDELNEKYDFFAGLEPPHQGDFTQTAPHIVISNALIGSAAQHPIIKEWKMRMRQHWQELEDRLPDSAKRVLLRTFYPFGDAVMTKISDPSRINVVLPPTYFYPLTFSEVSKGRLKKLSFFKRQLRAIQACFGKEKAPFVEIRPETMAVHYWGNSWVKSYEERLREMYRHMMQGQTEMQQKIALLEERLALLEAENATVILPEKENAA